MTDDDYTGEDAENELVEEEREQRKTDLKNKVDTHRGRVEEAENIVEALESALEDAKEARKTEKDYLRQLRDMSVDDFEDIGDVGLLKRSTENGEEIDIDDLDFRASSTATLEDMIRHAIQTDW